MNRHADITSDTAPSLKPHVRMQPDRITGRQMLLYPEGAIELDEPGIAILELCDGKRSLGGIVTELAEKYEVEPAVLTADVMRFLGELKSRGLLNLSTGNQP
jgi:pyrroloquinoline quinone biosynthesis protein D